MSQRIRMRKSPAESRPLPGPGRDVPTAAGAGDESTQLGKRIRDLRREAGLTLTDLARATGVSIGTLSQLERGLVSPTLRTLFTVGNALGVAPAWLIDPGKSNGQDREQEFIVRAGRRPRFLDSAGVRKDITSPPSSERLKGFFTVIQPGCGSGPQPYSHAGDEIGLVLSGTLELQVGDATFTLNEGDCFCFTSGLLHRFGNVGARPATVFWVNARS